MRWLTDRRLYKIAHPVPCYLLRIDALARTMAQACRRPGRAGVVTRAARSVPWCASSKGVLRHRLFPRLTTNPRSQCRFLALKSPSVAPQRVGLLMYCGDCAQGFNCSRRWCRGAETRCAPMAGDESELNRASFGPTGILIRQCTDVRCRSRRSIARDAAAWPGTHPAAHATLGEWPPRWCARRKPSRGRLGRTGGPFL